MIRLALLAAVVLIGWQVVESQAAPAGGTSPAGPATGGYAGPAMGPATGGYAGPAMPPGGAVLVNYSGGLQPIDASAEVV